ncbi:MAG: acetolactate synthase [Candidatus Nanopelagicales bacterium]
MSDSGQATTIEGHGGNLAVAAARQHGVETMWTLSGAHVFPLYDGAVKADPPIRLIDVRHEQTAVFAAEGMAKLTRTPGLAVLTAGPGVTNGVSAVTTAWFNGSPVVVLGGRAPAFRWGTGALQELDHPPLLAPVTKHAGTINAVADTATEVDRAFTLATSPHRGPVFLDAPMDQLFSRAEVTLPLSPVRSRVEADPDSVAQIATLIGDAERPVLVLGSDVWSDGAEQSALVCAETLGIPVVANGMGRGIVPAGHKLLATRARSTALKQADLVVVVGTPLDFRLGYGVFGDAKVVHIADDVRQLAAHTALAASVAGDLTAVLDGIRVAWEALPRHRDHSSWATTVADEAAAAVMRDRDLLDSAADPIHPARIYGELTHRLAENAVVIGDGGDFVSFAGKYIEPRLPGGWMDPGPYGCLGTGLGYAMAARVARPDAQVVLLLGDGAAGLSLMDVDTLVRHDLPAVMVVGNNGGWGLEKHPMQFLYGYDVAADLRPLTRYDNVVRALGGAGETVTEPGDIGDALDRAFASGVPYLVNVITDPAVAYPRSTTGV